MVAPQQALRQPAKVALAALAVLFIGSIVFYRERALFGDGAFLVFNIINFKTLYIQWGRYGSVVSQFLPYLDAKMGLSVKAALMAYGFSFHLFYLLSALIAYRLRQYR